ncbi:MAG TPA: DUF4265 domain-containing protein [Anaeromyxobacteraceae bacterium]|nr:DUF4265 domain-containing protein [Anaeromyxobacteraceae bacterium]
MTGDSKWERFLEARRNAPPGFVEVTFKLPPERLPMRAESMWAQQVGADLFVLRNSPFHADGVSFLDTVRAELRGPEWFFVAVHARSGHSTYRVFLSDRSMREPWERVYAPLKRLGCSIEGADERWCAVDVPPAADVQAVLMELRRGEREGRWEYEEGHFGHPRA